jgi:hypothetical protein
MNKKPGRTPEECREMAKNKRGPTIGRLDSVGRCAIEAARLYRHARRKELETIEAHRLASVLQVVAKCLEQSQIEERLENLEKLLIAREQPFRPKIVG